MEICVAVLELFLTYRRTDGDFSEHFAGAPKIGYGEW